MQRLAPRARDSEAADPDTAHHQRSGRHRRERLQAAGARPRHCHRGWPSPRRSTPPSPRSFGDVIGVEARALALHVVEGPGLNLARVPQGGRNFEYFGEDPFLTGTMGVAEIRAIQGHGVIAMAKHFIANEQETNRRTVNETIADRVLHELYLLPFEMAVKDGEVAAVMCSYNSVNGPHACEDRHHLTDVLRGQWGFSGYVQSDFFAVHNTAPTLLAGMDHEMPGSRNGTAAGGPWFTPERLQAALDAHRDHHRQHRHGARPPLPADVPARHLRSADRADADRLRARRRDRASRSARRSAVLLKNR